MTRLDISWRSVSQNVLAALCTAVIVLLTALPTTSWAQTVNFPEKPARHEFVVDAANLLSDTEARNINQIASAILKDEDIPIYVMTIPSLGNYGASHISLERYASHIFDEWEIGSRNRNYGMLLLVSKGDRRLRIELGRDWAGSGNRDAQYVVDQIITPRFKEDLFGQGLVEGVRGMDAMGRGLALQSAYLARWVMPTLASLCIVMICIAISLIRSGQKGFGYILMLGAFAVLDFILDIFLNSFCLSGDGMSDDGSSEGDGASGSW